jgi:DNA-binding NarL/FixJ family response regulator
MYREAVAGALAGAPGISVELTCASLAEVERRLPGSGAEVVVLDLRLPDVRGGEGVARLSERGLAVLVLSAQAGREDVMAAFEAGARGYLTKSADEQDIVAGVRAVAAGGTYVAPGVAGHLLAVVRGRQEPDRPGLSRREREVLALVAAGETDQAIARRLTIGRTTVRSHLDSIRDKTGRRRRAELTRLAVEEGLVGGPPSD